MRQHNIPPDGMKIRNKRTGEEFVIMPVTKLQGETTLTKALAALAVGIVLTVVISIVCRGARRLFT